VNRFLSLSALLSTADILAVPTITAALPLESLYSAATKDANRVCFGKYQAGFLLGLFE
jgi:hypothetical protein